MKFKKTFEALSLFSSLFMIIILLYVTVGAFRFWTDFYPYTGPLDQQLFWLALAVAIITSPGTLLQNQVPVDYKDMILNKGLTIVTSTAAQDITVLHRAIN